MSTSDNEGDVISDDSSFYGDERVQRKLQQTSHSRQERLLREPALDFSVNRLGHKPHSSFKQDVQSVGKDPMDAESAHEADPLEIVPVKRRSDEADSWQQSETVDQFLKRLPVADPSSASVGPWLWVHSPQLPRHQHEQLRKSDITGMIDKGSELLEAFNKRRATVEGELKGKAPGVITRKLNPEETQLEKDLLALGPKHRVTTGKWMLFPGAQDLPRYWRMVVEGTASGKLGPTAKVGTWSGQSNTLICVYTYDYTDEDDVRRVLHALVDLDLCSREGRPIYYKCDVYTHLGIESNNSYRLRASLFSSRDIFIRGEKELLAVAKKPVQKPDKKLDDFFVF